MFVDLSILIIGALLAFIVGLVWGVSLVRPKTYRTERWQ
jgi:hypothetical protein